MPVKSRDGWIDLAVVAPIIEDEVAMREVYPTLADWLIANRVYSHLAERERKNMPRITTGLEDEEWVNVAYHMGWGHFD